MLGDSDTTSIPWLGIFHANQNICESRIKCWLRSTKSTSLRSVLLDCVALIRWIVNKFTLEEVIELGDASYMVGICYEGLWY